MQDFSQIQKKIANDKEVNRKALICPMCKEELGDNVIAAIDICFDCYSKSY